MDGGAFPRGLVATAAVTVAALGLAAVEARANPDLELGAYLATECQTCHRFVSPGRKAAIPDLSGMAAETMVEVLKAYRAKTLSNPVMQTVAGSLKDEEMAAIAAYFSTRKR